MANNDVRFNMWMRADMKRELDEEARLQGRSSADIVRQLLSAYLLQRKIDRLNSQKKEELSYDGAK